MGNRSGWIPWGVAVLILIFAFFAWTQLRDCKEAKDGLAVQVEECNAAREKCEQDQKTTQAALDKCMDDLTGGDCCNRPPPGPIIDITTGPNAGGNYVSISGQPVNPVAPSGNGLNAKAFGALLKFEATVMIDGKPVTKSLRSATVKFGNKTLEILKVGDYPGVFGWKLDTTDLVPVAPNSDFDWRDDLCCSVPTIVVEYMLPGGGTGTASTAKLTVQAFNF